MAPAPPQDSDLAERGIVLRLLRSLTRASTRPAPSPTADLFEALKEAEDKVDKVFPQAKPSGDGVGYRDRMMEIAINRVRWQAWMTNGKELLGLLTGCGTLAICLGTAWQLFVV
ncbi:MAG TPA: hypothetical protein VNC16_13425 [Solirubrobacterales bacterium]|nr:hypothetical protein [Solirubrobacterales bacterium]